ncbi:MAG: class I SAM-dependent methyltransferase [Ignavibacteria bacterium]|nr:class I SAM-dependent methyltransferase [Ignavibacteria bacterium]
MSDHVCPWWLGYLLASPIRTLAQDPEKVLRPFVKKGDTTLDVGSGMGFFSLPMARLVGERGRVVCVDLQEKMINGLRRRASRAGLIDGMDLRVCTPASLHIDDLAGTIDFALAFAVVHEVPDAKRLLSEIHAALNTGGHLLLSEPSGHVSEGAFAKTLSVAESVGFRVAATAAIRRGHSKLLTKE